jgi:hypothetical protein
MRGNDQNVSIGVLNTKTWVLPTSGFDRRCEWAQAASEKLKNQDTLQYEFRRFAADGHRAG